MNPPVTVVIPALDREDMIGEALASVLAQGYEPLEVVVVDDGSTDGTAATAASYPGVRVISTPNQGVAQARNEGVAAATGTLITFLDSDDLMPAGRIARDVAILEAHPDWDGLLGYQEWFTDGAEMPGWVRKADGSVGDVQPCSALVRREVFDRVDRFDPALTHTEDFDWLMRVRDAGHHIAMLDELVVIRRMHPGNVSHARDAVAPQLLTIVHRQIARARSRAGEARSSPGGGAG